MPEPISVLRDTFLLGDQDAEFASISGVVRNADGTADISIVNITSFEGFPFPRTLTDYQFGQDGQITQGETVDLPDNVFSNVELTNGNRVIARKSGDTVSFTLADTQGNILLTQAVDDTEISFPDQAAIALPGGGFAVVWLDAEDEPFEGQTAVQFFDNDGVAISEQLTPGLGDDIATGAEDEQIAVATPSGGLGVLWVDDGAEFQSRTVKYAAYDADGESTVSELDLDLSSSRDAPQVSYRSDGSFVVVSSSGDARVFGADGSPISLGNTDLAAEGQNVVAVSMLSDGYVAAVQTVTTTNGRSVVDYAIQVYSDDGEPVGEPTPFADFQRPDGSIGRIDDVVIVTLDNDEFAVTWEQDEDFLGAEDSVMVKIFSASGDEITENRDPTILTSTALEFDENSTDASVVVGRDVDGDPLEFSIAPSDDGALFEIDAQSGALSFRTAQDFEAPGDLDGDAFYDVSVTVADGQGGMLTVPIQVSLTNLAETEQGGPQASDYDFSYIYGNEDNDIFPQPDQLDFASNLRTNDFIDLGGGNDAVRASFGDDYIIAGPGQDFQIIGGAGRDIFRFGEGDDTVRIRDFTQGEDLIFLAGGLTLDDLTAQSFTQSDGNMATRYTTEGGDRLILDGLADGVTQADLFSEDSPLPANEAPRIFPLFGSNREYFENDSFAGTYGISDRNEDGLSVSVSLSGADAGLFEFTEATETSFGVAYGQATFVQSPDFERPTDANGNNIYEFTLTATDSEGLSTSEDFSIAISDVDDSPPPGSDTYDQILRGTDGDDRLNGTLGRDYILGGDGADFIRASGQADLVDAGAGLDYRVYGGGGDDIFVFDGDSERVRVLDFELGADKILLGDGIAFEDLTIRSWSSSRSLEDGGFETFGGINVIYANDAGDENRFSIAVEGRSPSIRDISADDFLLARDFEFPTLPEPDLLT